MEVQAIPAPTWTESHLRGVHLESHPAQGPWHQNVSLAKQATDTMVSQGADVLFLMLDNAFAGAQQAIHESGKDVKVFSIIVPRCETAKNIVGCATLNSAQFEVSIVKDYLDGKLPTSQPRTTGSRTPRCSRSSCAPVAEAAGARLHRRGPDQGDQRRQDHHAQGRLTRPLDPVPSDSNQARWTSLTAAGVVVLSFEGTIVRLLDLSQWTILLVRGPLMAVGLGVIFWLGWGLGGWGLLAAALFGCDNLLFIVALRTTSVANTLVLLSTAPVFAGALGRLVLGERVPARTWLVTATVLCRVAVIVSGSFGGGHLAGDLAALGAALAIAGTLVLIRRARSVVMLPSMALGALAAALVAAPLADPGSVTGPDALLLALVGLVIAPVAFGAISITPRHLPAQEVSLLMLLEAVLGPLWAWVILGQAPGRATLLGGALIGIRQPVPAA